LFLVETLLNSSDAANNADDLARFIAGTGNNNITSALNSYAFVARYPGTLTFIAATWDHHASPPILSNSSDAAIYCNHGSRRKCQEKSDGLQCS
jgi:hypothetical protein